jgi:hypothetical protein
MKDNRLGGIALIAGTIGSIITLIIHPSGGHDLFVPDKFAHIAAMMVAAHSLAIASMWIVFLGALALTRCLAPNRIAIAALVIYGFASAAVMSAATVDGFVGPSVLRHVIFDTSPATGQWRALFVYNQLFVEAFTQVFVVASAVAIVLWSASILKTRLLPLGSAIYGLVLGVGSVLAIAAGASGNAHAVHLVMLSQIIWFLLVGILLWRLKKSDESAGNA